jgi:PKD repeat protein
LHQQQISNVPTACQWNFGDLSPNSTLQNPTHTFEEEGSYDVTLTVSNAYGNSTLQKTNYITVLPPPPFLPGWSYRKLHTMSGSTTALTNYPVRLLIFRDGSTVESANIIQTGLNTDPDFSDLRFTTDTGTPISYWIESRNVTSAIVWVKVPSIPTTGTQLYVYYGNGSVLSESNGDLTFPMFDDFQTLNTTRWIAAGSVSTSTSQASLTSGSWIQGVSLPEPLFGRRLPEPTRIRSRVLWGIPHRKCIECSDSKSLPLAVQ